MDPAAQVYSHRRLPRYLQNSFKTDYLQATTGLGQNMLLAIVVCMTLYFAHMHGPNCAATYASFVLHEDEGLLLGTAATTHMTALHLITEQM